MSQRVLGQPRRPASGRVRVKGKDKAKRAPFQYDAPQLRFVESHSVADLRDRVTDLDAEIGRWRERLLTLGSSMPAWMRAEIGKILRRLADERADLVARIHFLSSQEG